MRALVMKSRKNLPQGCVPLNYAIPFAYFVVTFCLVALHFTLSLDNGIVTLTACCFAEFDTCNLQCVNLFRLISINVTVP